MAQANPFDQFDSQAQPVPVQALRPIIGSVTPEEQARRDAEEMRQREAADRAARGEQRDIAEFEGTGGKPTEAQGKVSVLLTRIKGGVQDIMAERATDPNVQAPGFAETVSASVLGEGMVTRKVRGEGRRIVADAQRDVLDALLTLGTGAAYNPEQLEAETLAHFPQYGDSPREIEVKNARLQRLIESAKVQAGPKWDEIEAAISPFMATVGGNPTVDPATRPAGEGEAFLTEQDKELQAKLSEAFARGATLDELNAIAGQYGQNLNNVTQEQIDSVRAAGGGISVVPTGRDVPDPRDEMGFLEGIGETITGSARETAETEALPDWASMPELNSLSVDSFQAALGTMMTDPAESVAILRAQFPDIRVRQDEKGNYILRSGADGKEYAIKPGFQMSDVPRIGGALAAFTPAGRATTFAGGALAGAGTQAAIEGTQAATGGQFNSDEVLLAGGGGAAGVGLSKGVDAVQAFRAGRRTAPDVTPVAPAPATPVAMADELTAPPLAPELQAEVGAIARQAIGRGRPARDAQEQLAIMAKVNPEAKAAAGRLGMDLPIDILSDDTRLLTVTGLARSQAGSDAEAAWKNLAIDTIEKADASLEQVGASRNLAGVSNEVRTTLQSNMDELEAGANSLREEVNAAINVQDRVAASNLQGELGKTINDLGGIDEAKQAFSAEEKKLLAMLGEGAAAKMPTYARLDRIRSQIGEALFKGKGPWVDTEEATLKRYYGALAKDRLDYVADVGGADLAEKMRVSNDLYSKMYDVRSTMQTLFGKQLENDISTTITNAIKQGSSGDAKNLRKIIENVPEDMQAKTLMTGLMAATGKSGPNGGFSFTKYADVYRGLRENAPVYSVVAKTIGPEADRILRDLYSISKRMARGENAVIKTGKSNQPLINALAADGLVSSVAKASAKRAGITGASSLAGGMVGGPIGSGLAAGVAEAVQQAVSSGGKSNLDKLHSVLVSEPFKNLAEKAAAGTVKDADINRVANDKSWRKFASSLLGINDAAGRKAWLRKSITASATVPATNTEQQPATKIEVR